MRSPCSPKVSDHSPPFAHTNYSDNTRLFTVLEELSNELTPVNTRRVLRENHSKKKDLSEGDGPDEPDELNEPKKLDEQDQQEDPDVLDRKERHRKGEQGRRTTIRGLLHEISAFFLVTGDKEVSGGDVILFGKSITAKSERTVCLRSGLVITYLRIGVLAFPGLVRPRIPGDGQQL